MYIVFLAERYYITFRL